MNRPQRNVVLFPLKSRRYHTSSDWSRIVPASTGENELGVCVSAPATLMSDDMYFLKPGNILQPDVKKQDVKSKVKIKNFIK